MKAAVLHKFGETPLYEDFPDPIPGKDEVIVDVKAVALENVDKMMAAGSHFASGQFFSQLPAIVGFDGIGRLPDGGLIGFSGMTAPYGAMAEKAVVKKTFTVPVPEGVDAVVAAAVPSSALTALFPLKWGAKMQAGETVLINGATGVSGRLAVQIAKLLGAGRVIGTGRNPNSLQQVNSLGADAVIDLKLPDNQLVEAFKNEAEKGIDVILDFLWDHPTELLIQALVPHELGFAKRRIRLIQIGEKAGPAISLSADSLRTSGLEIAGGSAGATPEAIAAGTDQVWKWIKEKKLQVEIETVPLSQIEDVWKRADFQGKRIVIIP
ncbi:zinc-binding alcohol dehydrogenase family protein [Terrilactibacillus sp. S3-3]|nr:zinc-binding alcohol dehydrogenase family protein [Terrilactibacillus sp. S3-3]